MRSLDLVRPLEEDWRDAIDREALARRWPTTHDVAKLGAAVARLSSAYNDASVARAVMREAGAARLGFSFARDVPKGAAAVRELLATGLLPTGSFGAIRVLDVGAGLGAMTWGLVRALAAAGASGRVEATWIDSDKQALAVGSSLARARSGEGRVALRVTSTMTALEALDASSYDVVLVGHLLSELDSGLPADARAARHSEFLSDLLRRRAVESGAVVVVEPALRDRTRHLHRVRDRLVVAGATVFAPCLHAAPCPALARETDWCHEDVSVDLPSWLVPVARAAGLRREGLTFSYVVLRKDGATPSRARDGRAAVLRVVSSGMRSKGKRDAFLCGGFATEGAGSCLVPARVRVTRLDRDASLANAAWESLERGDLVAVSPPPELEHARIGVATRVERVAADPITREVGEKRGGGSRDVLVTDCADDVTRMDDAESR